MFLVVYYFVIMPLSFHTHRLGGTYSVSQYNTLLFINKGNTNSNFYKQTDYF